MNLTYDGYICLLFPQELLSTMSVLLLFSNAVCKILEGAFTSLY